MVMFEAKFPIHGDGVMERAFEFKHRAAPVYKVEIDPRELEMVIHLNTEDNINALVQSIEDALYNHD